MHLQLKIYTSFTALKLKKHYYKTSTAGSATAYNENTCCAIFYYKIHIIASFLRSTTTLFIGRA
jgi:hypothetical protein